MYLSSSIYEGFGLTTLEALECGLPVFGFDIPANRTLIADNVTGRLIKCYDNFYIRNYNDINNYNDIINYSYSINWKQNKNTFK